METVPIPSPVNDKREEWTDYQRPLDFITEDEREVGGIRRVFKGSVVFSTLMPSTQIVRRESSSHMHSGHRVNFEFLERSERNGE